MSQRDEQGNVISFMGIGQDITARVFHEREYSKLIDTANVLIFGVNGQGSVKVWNLCAMRLVGINCGIGRSRHSSLLDLVRRLQFLYVGCQDELCGYFTPLRLFLPMAG